MAPTKIYCSATESGPWMDVIKRLDRPMAMDFLDHLSSYKQLYSSVTGRYFDRNDNREVQKWHDTVLVSKWKLRPPNIDGKPVLGTDDLLVLQTFNIAYDEGVFPSERHRIYLSGCYLLLAFTGARPGEIVDNEKRRPNDGTYEDLYQ
ncbi:FluG domain-containing protein [Hirsutella rhossiliensis]